MLIDLTAPRCLLGSRLEVQKRLRAVARERGKCDSWRNVAALWDVVPVVQDDLDSTAIQFGIFSSFLSGSDANVDRWWFIWIRDVLSEREWN